MPGRSQTRRAPQYQWIIQERNGDAILDAIDLEERRFGFRLNRPAYAEAALRNNARAATVQALTPGKTEAIIYRNGVPLETVFQLARSEFEGDADKVRLGLQWQGIMSYLQAAVIHGGTSQGSTGQSRLAWNRINNWQSRTGANYGITDGGAPGTDPNKSASWDEDTELLEAIIAQSERANGYDFALDAQRRWQTYYPQRGEDKSSEIVLDYGVHIAGFSFAADTSPGRLVTDARVSGGEGAIATAASASARTTYGRREASVQYSDVISDTSPLQQYADSIIERRASVSQIPQVRLTRNNFGGYPFGTFWLGDTVRVRIAAGRLVNIDQPMRIVGIDFELDENGNEDVTLTFNDAADEEAA